MSSSITIIGGHSGAALTGLVTVPLSYSESVASGLQSLLGLGGLSSSVLSGAAFLDNENIAGNTTTDVVAPNVSGHPGLLELTNTTGLGGVVGGTASTSVTVPAGYQTVIVEAPGAETITGNGLANTLYVFGSQSAVTLVEPTNSSGSVVASGNTNLLLAGQSWSVYGGSIGNVSLNVDALVADVTLQGAGNSSIPGTPSNAIGSYSPNLSVLSMGTDDFVLTGAPELGATDTVTVTGFANVRDIGAFDTVFTSGTGSFSGSFGEQGGDMVFINNSSSASQIIASLDPTTGLIDSSGSVTVEAGAGGGVYDGGTNGHNSLIGGTGLVTLFAAGQSNFLSTNGSTTGSGYNLLNAASASNDTLVAGPGSTNNVFFAGTGTESITSQGTGAQTYFIGTLGSETISGSTVSGASNTYIFNQAASQGGGTDVIENFKVGVSHGFINPNDSVTGVSIGSFESLTGANSGTQIDLTNGTTIKLIGVSAASLNASIIGGTTF